MQQDMKQDMTRSERRNHWRDLIEQQKTSGRNIADYCRDNRINQSQFYKWRRRLLEQKPSTGGFLELIPRATADSGHSGISIRMDGKLSIDINPGFDPFVLRNVVETLRGLSL
jgi:hypothetical protein